MKDIYWKLIYSASGRTQADLIAGRLKSEDIPIRLEYESVASIYAITIDGLGEVKIFVPNGFRQRCKANPV